LNLREAEILLQIFFLHAFASAKEHWNDPSKVLSASDGTSFEGRMRKIFQKRVLRIAQVALYRPSCDPFVDIRDQLSTRSSHEASTRLYQAVLFDVVSTRGVDYMTKQDFFNPDKIFNDEERIELKRKAKR